MFSRGFGADYSPAFPPDRRHVEIDDSSRNAPVRDKNSLTPNPVGCFCPVAARTVGWLHIPPNHEGILVAFSRETPLSYRCSQPWYYLDGQHVRVLGNMP